MTESKEIPRRPLLAALVPALVLTVFGGLAASEASAQRSAPGPAVSSSSTVSGIPATAELLNANSSIVVSVYDESGALLNQQALVRITGTGSAPPAWGTTATRSEVTFNSLAPSSYQVEVNSAEFQTAIQQIDVLTAQTYHLSITLK